MSMSPPFPASAAVTPPRRRFASLRSIMALVLREMGSSYGRSPGGYLWAVLEPVAGITLLALVFSAAFRAPPIGINFAMFYATGMMPFLLFSDVQGKVAGSLLYSRQLLAYPTVTFVDAMLARFLLNGATQVLVSYLVFFGCAILFETRITPDLPRIVEATALALLLALGIGALNCFLFTAFPLWQRAWSILMRPMFLLSGVVMLLEAVPQPYRDWLWYNPLTHVVGLMRAGFYSTYEAAYVSIDYVVTISLVCLALGLLLLRRHHRELLSNS